MVSIKSEKEIEVMREGGKLLAQIMNELQDSVIPGKNTLEIDKLAEKLVFDMGATPAFKGYGAESGMPFPGTICASVNDEVVHGIPSKEVVLKEGDIFKIDIGMKYKGMFTDMARTFPVGKISEDAQNITKVVHESFNKGVAAMGPGKKMSAYSKAVQKHAERNGFSIIRNLVGHGIGKKLHEDPQIPNYYQKGCYDFKMQPGMLFALEPMINAGSYETKIEKDGWTFKTKDGSLSAHWENTVLITNKGVEILTLV